MLLLLLLLLTQAHAFIAMTLHETVLRKLCV